MGGNCFFRYKPGLQYENDLFTTTKFASCLSILKQQWDLK